MNAELVLYNGHVYTMDPSEGRVGAVAVAGNRIAAVGDDAAMRALLGPGGQAINLEGRAVVPGLIDAHVHFGWCAIAAGQKRLDLDNVPTKAKAVAQVAERARALPPGRWILGGGWNQNVWPVPVMPTVNSFPERYRSISTG